MKTETIVFTFWISNSVEEWADIFDSSEINEFHKDVGLMSIYRSKSLSNPKEVIVIHQAEEGVADKICSDPEIIKKFEAGVHIYSSTIVTRCLSN